MLAHIRMGLIEEFKNPKYESLYITELKEINKYPNESVWDLDQCFKTLMAKVCFRMRDVQHKDWFVVALVPHIRILIMQWNIATQNEASEIAMNIEASPIGDRNWDETYPITTGESDNSVAVYQERKGCS